MSSLERASDRLLATVAWFVVAFSCLQIVLFGFGRDQGIYAVVAEAVLSGKMPYRDAWDFKPPGIYVVYAVAQALFGKAMGSVRVLEALGVVAMVLAFRKLGRTLFGSPLAGLVGGALAALIHAELEFWHTGQPESFGGFLTAFALVGATGDGVDANLPPSERFAAWARVGLLFGLAFLMKPPLGGGALACAGYLAFTEFRRTKSAARAWPPVFVVGAFSLVPIFVVAAWFLVRGAWPALSWTLFEFVPGYTALGGHGGFFGGLGYGLGEALTGFSFVIPLGIALAVLLPKLTGRERGGIGLVFWIVLVHVVGITLQAKFFQYHYGATLPLLAFVAGLGIFKAWRKAARVPVIGQLALLATIGFLAAQRVALRHNPGTFWERSADRMRFLASRAPRDAHRVALDAKLYRVVDYDLETDRHAGAVVTVLTEPTDSVFVWGFEPSVYWFSRRRPASRYLYDVPQRSTWQRDRSRADLMTDLARDPPRAIVVQRADVFSFVTGDDLDSREALATFPELETLVDTWYGHSARVGNLEIYARRRSPRTE